MAPDPASSLHAASPREGGRWPSIPVHKSCGHMGPVFVLQGWDVGPMLDLDLGSDTEGPEIPFWGLLRW